MPGRFLSEAERDRLGRFPEALPEGDLITFFTLSEEDHAFLGRLRGDPNRLGCALQIAALRLLGFVPDDMASAPPQAVRFVADQLHAAPIDLKVYGSRVRTRQQHLQQVMHYLRFRRPTPMDFDLVGAWLLERALEHDRPTLLFEQACEKLRRDRLLRPGVTVLERLVVRARTEAHTESLRRLGSLLTDQVRARLDALLIPEPETGRTKLSWLRQRATSNTPGAIQDALEKLAFLRKSGVGGWDLQVLSTNRIGFLARQGRRYSNQALLRMGPERRYPILACFLHQTLVDVTDEIVDLFDACLAKVHAKAKRNMEEYRKAAWRATEAKVLLFQEIGRLVLDPSVPDAQLREVIYQHVSPEVLQAALEEAERLTRPLLRDRLGFLDRHYGYLRRFTPAVLEALPFRSHEEDDPVLKGVDLLRRLDRERRRKLPEDAPTAFIGGKWTGYVNGLDGAPERRAYELCLLSELRDRLRAGDVFLERSRRYADPETYLIPKMTWLALRAEVAAELAIPTEATARLDRHAGELERLLPSLGQLLATHEGAPLRFEGGDIVVSPLEADTRSASAQALEAAITERLPRVELSDLLVEVDEWTGFSHAFTHAGGSSSRNPELLPHLQACLLAQGAGMGLSAIAQSADLSYDRLAWTNAWYVREETLRAAITALVNVQYRQPLSKLWGGGTLSSSDGQRFPVSGKVRPGAALPRYFGYGRGITFYTWTSDQYSQYGTKVISATVRDATYVLDEILDNETELQVLEHATDTAGTTDLIFALFDLVGLQFSPRIRDLSAQRLYRLEDLTIPEPLDGRFRGRVNRPLIEAHWDDLLRVAGSLKRGYVTASLLVSKLQAYPRQNRLTRVLQEYGRLVKTIFVLRYYESEAYRRRIHAQLNKGEALHDLRRFLFFGSDGKIRRKQEEALADQALCLSVMANAVIVWNTVYMQAVADALRAEGYEVKDEDLAHLSPARFQHINRYGKYRFDVEAAAKRQGLRPLRLGRRA